MGTPIFIVNATDPDQGAGGSVLYSFQPPSNFFAIDSARGIVTVIRGLDYEVTQAYQLQVNATVSLRTLVSSNFLLNKQGSWVAVERIYYFPILPPLFLLPVGTQISHRLWVSHSNLEYFRWQHLLMELLNVQVDIGRLNVRKNIHQGNGCKYGLNSQVPPAL